ncbi:MAG: hypothetical protein K8R87_07345 [Verrucomicrobia bacterium]|nr:hypothetical protein [Verrucomicrobiota bacterium]
MTPYTTTPNANEQFASLPLHDATLKEVRLDWQQRVCVASVLAFVQADQPAIARQVVWHGVSEALIPHRAPWGESAFINTVRAEAGGIFVVEMQSGDEIRIVAERFEFR